MQNHCCRCRSPPLPPPPRCRRIQSLFNALGDEAQGKTIGLGGDGRYFNKEAVCGLACSALLEVGGLLRSAVLPSERACGVRVFLAAWQLALLVPTQPYLVRLSPSLLPQVQVILKLAAGNGIKKVGGDGQAAGAAPLIAAVEGPKTEVSCPTPPTATC